MEYPYRYRGALARTAAWAFWVVSVAGCSKKPEVTGEVHDGFGKPLPGATVKVEKTTFGAITDPAGRYAVQYVPGKVLVTITREGYNAQQLNLDIATEAKYPAETVTLYRLPAERGIVAYGESDYVTLARSKLVYTSEHWGDNSSGGFNDIYAVAGDFPVLKAGVELTFLDNDDHARMIYAVGPNGVVLTHTQRWDGGPTVSETKTIMADRRLNVAPGISLRKVTLAQGRYAFCNAHNDREAVAFLFEVK